MQQHTTRLAMHTRFLLRRVLSVRNMEFQYYLLVSKDSPLAVKEIGGYEDLEGYIELLHGDVRLPNGDYVDMMEIPENINSRKRIHVYERGSQFNLLQGLQNFLRLNRVQLYMHLP